MKALITFASMSGNTEDMAAILKRTLEGKGIDTEMMEFDDTNAEDLSSYDYVFIGSYTWGDGDLPYEAEDFMKRSLLLNLATSKQLSLDRVITAIRSFVRLSIHSMTC